MCEIIDRYRPTLIHVHTYTYLYTCMVLNVSLHFYGAKYSGILHIFEINYAIMPNIYECNCVHRSNYLFHCSYVKLLVKSIMFVGQILM